VSLQLLLLLQHGNSLFCGLNEAVGAGCGPDRSTSDYASSIQGFEPNSLRESCFTPAMSLKPPHLCTEGGIQLPIDTCDLKAMLLVEAPKNVWVFVQKNCTPSVSRRYIRREPTTLALKLPQITGTFNLAY
jgi:hypothetical protein